MTTNEAIKILTNIEAYLIAGNPIWDTDTIREAFDMAIDALENYDGVADALNGYAELYRKLKEKYDNLKKQNQWIPCDKELPNPAEHSAVLVTDCEGKVRCTRALYVITMREVFIAWMPLPKPYERRTE